MPAEWEPHEATWIAWPHNREDWPGRFTPIPWVYGEIVRKLAAVERVRILVQSPALESQARRILTKVGANLDAVEFFQRETDRVWTRDYCPLFVKNGRGEIALTAWRFNAWAKYDDWRRDATIPAFLGERLQLPVFTPEMVLEGGSIDVNGQGLLLTTEECLLSPIQARNPDLGREEIERRLGDYLGAGRVIWLKNGIAGDDTHGHVDDLARFVNPETVVLCAESDPADTATLRSCGTQSGETADAAALVVRWPAAARQLRQLLRRQRTGAGADLQRPQRSSSADHPGETVPRSRSGGHQLHRFHLGLRRAALHDAAAAGLNQTAASSRW